MKYGLKDHSFLDFTTNRSRPGWLDEYQVGGNISIEGYKENSPDKNNPYNIIPSNRITMKDVTHPVIGTDNLGNTKIMYPGAEYTYPGQYVKEVPLKQYGGQQDENETNNQEDNQANSESWLEQGEAPVQLPNQNKRQYKGRTQKRIDRSLYSPHPGIHHYQAGGYIKPIIDGNNIESDRNGQIEQYRQNMAPSNDVYHSSIGPTQSLSDHPILSTVNWLGRQSILSPFAWATGYESPPQSPGQDLAKQLTYMMPVGMESKVAEKGIPVIDEAVSEISHSGNFPVSVIKKIPGNTGMPTVTIPPGIDREQQILNSFGVFRKWKPLENLTTENGYKYIGNYRDVDPKNFINPDNEYGFMNGSNHGGVQSSWENYYNKYIPNSKENLSGYLNSEPTKNKYGGQINNWLNNY